MVCDYELKQDTVEAESLFTAYRPSPSYLPLSMQIWLRSNQAVERTFMSSGASHTTIELQTPTY